VHGHRQRQHAQEAAREGLHECGADHQRRPGATTPTPARPACRGVSMSPRTTVNAADASAARQGECSRRRRGPGQRSSGGVGGQGAQQVGADQDAIAWQPVGQRACPARLKGPLLDRVCDN
jgi:hypothetical protein